MRREVCKAWCDKEKKNRWDETPQQSPCLSEGRGKTCQQYRKMSPNVRNRISTNERTFS